MFFTKFYEVEHDTRTVLVTTWNLDRIRLLVEWHFRKWAISQINYRKFRGLANQRVKDMVTRWLLRTIANFKVRIQCSAIRIRY